MAFKSLYEQISCSDTDMLREDNPIGSRIIYPEYSLHLEDKKTYPLPKEEHLFAPRWNVNPSHRLYETIKPSAVSFSYSCHLESGDKTQLHTYEYLELPYIVSGRFRQRILGNDITFKQGDLCLIGRDCLHQDYLDSSPTSILFLDIANDISEEIMDSYVTARHAAPSFQLALSEQKNPQRYLYFKPNPDIGTKLEECLESLLRELITHNETSSYICRGLLMRIFHILSTDYDFSLSRELYREMNWLTYEETTTYIRQRYQGIIIQQPREQFHLQEGYLNCLLCQETDMTYTEYMQKLRPDEAERLLTPTSLSIRQIADAVGYRNKGYFYWAFTEHYQMTPARFRKKRTGA